uniref:Uncharacterized protein n=1 Tax=Geospiza parvula TaxID=87175 RepID=A0A8U8ANW8_GEOPR
MRRGESWGCCWVWALQMEELAWGRKEPKIINGLDWKRCQISFISTLLLWQGHLPLSPVSSLALGTARDPGAAPAALGTLCQGLPTLPGNNSSLPRSHPALPSGTGSHSLGAGPRGLPCSG